MNPVRLILLAVFFMLAATPAGAQDLFWDTPELLLPRGESARYPQTTWEGDGAVVMWQERKPGTWPQYTFSLAHKKTGEDWQVRRNVLDAVTIPGLEAPLFTLSAGLGGLLTAAVLQEDSSLQIYRALGPEGSFTPVTRLRAPTGSSGTLLAPKLYRNPQGQFLLFATVAFTDSYQIYKSSGSADGSTWTPLVPAVTATPEQNKNFFPTYAYHKGKGYLAYQSQIGVSFQILLRSTSDGGTTWSEPQVLSNFTQDGVGADRFNNQRPHLTSDGTSLHLVWERGVVQGAPQVEYARLSDGGEILEREMISDGVSSTNSPQIFFYRNTAYITWFDSSTGTFGLFWAYRTPGRPWQSGSLPGFNGDSVFAQPAPTADGLYFFWENRLDNQSSVVLLRPDLRALPPSIRPEGFRAGGRANRGTYRFTFDFPRDPSGVAGFNFIATQNIDEPVPRDIPFSILDKERTAEIDTEGTWYIKGILRDRAGNWSPPAVLSFYLDKTPPYPVRIIPPLRDENGYLPSNTFEIQWEPRSADTAGYNYRLEFVGSGVGPIDWDRISIPAPGPFSITENPRASYTNRENGLWALSVVALDEAGNPSEPSVYFFRLGRFVATTRIDGVNYQQDEFGRVNVRLNGRGFDTEGRVLRVAADRDGQAPWDFETSDFQLLSDRSILLGTIERLLPGTYRMGVYHPQRQWIFSTPSMRVDEKGTVKFGDFRVWGEEVWSFSDPSKWIFSVTSGYFWLVMGLLGTWFLLSGTQVVAVIREARVMVPTRRIITEAMGGKVVSSIKQDTGVKKRRGLKLRGKFTLSILGLTVSVILMLSMTLGLFIIDNSRRSLAVGLQQKTSVLANSLSRIAASYLNPIQENLLLPKLPPQINSMEEAVYATITGAYNVRQLQTGEAVKPGYNYVWASNDPDIGTKYGGPWRAPYAKWPLQDPVTEDLAKLEGEINTRARQELGGLQAQIAALEKEQSAYTQRVDAESQEIVARYDAKLDELDEQASQILDNILSTTLKSHPPFDPENLSDAQTRYIFYKPIIYRVANDETGTYFRGAVRIEVSVESILAQITAARNQLINLTAIIAAIAIGLSLVGALILATFTVNPIKVLARGVEQIRNTEDKEDLKDFNLQIKTRDELADLADSVNTMAYGLYKAAAAAKDLTVGKDTQKMFINLDKDSSGRKITTASFSTPEIELFGYYEGAKGVSGDYFDYGNLNDEYLYFIKCDVSGKGVPAALIMVEVATLVLNHFRFWDPKKDGVRLAPTVARINTLLEERGFKGRFAALTLGLLNKKTRRVVLCHAGDKMIQLYNHQMGKMETRVLDEVPATGVFSQDLMDLKGMAYKEVVMQLHPGDILFMYTDGIEETQRKFRDSRFDVMAFWDPKDLSTRTAPGSKRVVNGRDEQSIDNEDLGPEKVHQIIEALIHQGRFRMEKTYNPLGEEALDFDFSTTDGSMRDIIMGLAAVEKVWRLYPDPRATSEDILRVDVEIDRILKQCFYLYKQYFSTAPLPRKKDDPGEYLYFPSMVEDDQYDDLTLLGIRIK